MCAAKTLERVKAKAEKDASKGKCSLPNVSKFIPENDSDVLSFLITLSAQEQITESAPSGTAE